MVAGYACWRAAAAAPPAWPVRKILEVTGLSSVFTVHDDLAGLNGQ